MDKTSKTKPIIILIIIIVIDDAIDRHTHARARVSLVAHHRVRHSSAEEEEEVRRAASRRCDSDAIDRSIDRSIDARERDRIESNHDRWNDLM